MSSRRIPPAFDGRSIHTPGTVRHGPYSAGSLPPSDFPRNKIEVQEAEMERLARENQKLASAHVGLREELVSSQKELQKLHAHIGSIHTESDIQIRSLLTKIAKMEADLKAGESLKKDLQQAHKEAQSLVSTRQELTLNIQKTNEELKKANVDVKRIPEMHAELDGLRQEHQRLRSTFEREKGLNIEKVEQMHAMEKNLISLAREVEKLRAEVLNADKRARDPYGSSFAGSDSPYPSIGQRYIESGHSGSHHQVHGAPDKDLLNPHGAVRGIPPRAHVHGALDGDVLNHHGSVKGVLHQVHSSPDSDMLNPHGSVKRVPPYAQVHGAPDGDALNPNGSLRGIPPYARR